MLEKGIVDLGGEGGIFKCGETVRSSAGCNSPGIPYLSRVGISQELGPVHSLSGLNRFEVGSPCQGSWAGDD